MKKDTASWGGLSNLLKRMYGSSLCVIFLGVSIAATAQTCNDNMPTTTPTSDFVESNDGAVVTDKATGLSWMRCSVGQTWSGGTCTNSESVPNESVFQWKDALQIAADYTFAGYSDWRLPNKNELESIVELRCHDAALNAVAFPNTPSERFWSSTTHAFEPTGAWSVSFMEGKVFHYNKGNYQRIRLVRGG